MTTGSGMTLEPCLEAIVAGDGINREIVQFDEERRSIVLCAIAGLFLDMRYAGCEGGEIVSVADRQHLRCAG